MIGKKYNDGFTLIELMLSMAFISFILLFMVAAILQVTRLYVKGSAIRQINQTGRQLMDEVATTLRESSRAVYVPDRNRLCAGNTSYVWNVEGQTTNTFGVANPTVLRFVSVQDPGATVCDSPMSSIDQANSVDLIGADITPLSFSVKQEGRLWDVSVVLSTGGSNSAIADSTTPTGFACKADNQFCALGDFETSVYTRGGQ